jgi:hypothetical protein
MERLTRNGYFSQRHRAAFSRQLDVHGGDEPTVLIKFRPSAFFLENAQKLPKKVWQADNEGNFVAIVRNVETPFVPLEYDEHGKRFDDESLLLVFSLDDFPVGIPDEDWLNSEILHTEPDGEMKQYHVLTRPMKDSFGRLSLYIGRKDAVYDDSAGSGKGRDTRDYRSYRPYR